LPFSWLFGLAVALRGTLYSLGWLPVSRVATPVVSIGNLSVGGSGKTPLAIWLVGRLRGHGLESVVVTRGYGGSARQPVVVDFAETGGCEDGDWLRPLSVRDAFRSAGDEAALIALRAACPVVVHIDRARACRLAERLYSPQVIVLDDGFQHRRLHRDLDVLVLNGTEDTARMLPAGPLREGTAAQNRADVVVGPLHKVATGLVSGVEAGVDDVEPVSLLAGKRTVAFAGIGSPGQFLSMLEQAGALLEAELIFPDHHPYSTADWRRIETRGASAEYLVTTEKDMVRLSCLEVTDERLRAVRIGIADGEPAVVVEKVLARLSNDPPAGVGQLDASGGSQHHRRPHQRVTSGGG
jgi:tetraacyldisaccharide 4'-kinase